MSPDVGFHTVVDMDAVWAFISIFAQVAAVVFGVFVVVAILMGFIWWRARRDRQAMEQFQHSRRA